MNKRPVEEIEKSIHIAPCLVLTLQKRKERWQFGRLEFVYVEGGQFTSAKFRNDAIPAKVRRHLVSQYAPSIPPATHS
jgi:hypothetical protein